MKTPWHKAEQRLAAQFGSYLPPIPPPVSITPIPPPGVSSGWSKSNSQVSNSASLPNSFTWFDEEGKSQSILFSDLIEVMNNYQAMAARLDHIEEMLNEFLLRTVEETCP